MILSSKQVAAVRTQGVLSNKDRKFFASNRRKYCVVEDSEYVAVDSKTVMGI